MTLATWTLRLPVLLIAAAAALMAAGWLAIGRAEELATDLGFAQRQLNWCCLGIAVAVGVSLPSYHVLQRLSYTAYAVAMALLLLVYFFPPINGAYRWIRLGPIGLQPSEFAKLAFVLALARYLMFRENYRRFRGLLAPLAIALVPSLLILREPDLGTAVIFVPVALAMLLAAGARGIDLAKLALTGVLLLPLLWSQMSREQRSRVTSLVDQTPAGQRPGDDGYQLHQSKQMLALGGWRGSAIAGDAVDDPGAYHLPEAHTDFIISIVGERFGLWGVTLLLLLYVLLAGQGLSIAAATREPFGRLLCVGLTTLIGVQALVNTGMAVGLLPVTGLSLPLVSYGGSGVLANCVAIGLLMNVAIRPGYDLAGEPFRWRLQPTAD
jgi:cell division protein FtsW (lipid II flippase)